MKDQSRAMATISSFVEELESDFHEQFPVDIRLDAVWLWEMGDIDPAPSPEDVDQMISVYRQGQQDQQELAVSDADIEALIRRWWDFAPNNQLTAAVKAYDLIRAAESIMDRVGADLPVI